MDQETFNLSIRKFLKMVGINSQREIEQAVAKALGSADIKCGLTIRSHAADRRDSEVEIRVEIPLNSFPRVIRSLEYGAGTRSKMYVKVDEAWNQELPCPVDFFNSSGNGHIRAISNRPNAGSSHDYHGIGERRATRAINQHSSDDGFLDGLFRRLAPRQKQRRKKGKPMFQRARQHLHILSEP